MGSCDAGRFWSKCRLDATGCWLWTASTCHWGYGQFRTGSHTDGTARTVRSHRYAWELTHGPIPTGMVVRHKCDVPACCNPNHLELGTHRDNAMDREVRGRGNQPRGAAHGRARLTPALATEMRAAYAAGGRTQQSLAAEYGVSTGLVSYVVRGMHWAAPLVEETPR
jgi:hypothetical protein